MKYPDFCCQCCGYTNGDMYIDWFFGKHGRWPDKGDWVEYWRCRSSNYESLYKELKSGISRCNTCRGSLRGRPVGSVKRKGQDET